MLNDKKILEIFLRDNGTIISSKTSENYLKYHLEQKEYLINRYPKEEFVSYSFTIWRILNNLEDRPVCKICGKPLTRMKTKYCSKNCANKDEEAFKKEGLTLKNTIANFKKSNPELYKIRCEQTGKSRKKHIKEDPEWHNRVMEKTRLTLTKNHPDDPTCGQFGSKRHEEAMIKKYGDKNYNNAEKMKETIAHKLKEDPDFYNKINFKRKQTLLEKIGYENNSQDPKNKEIISKIWDEKSEEEILNIRKRAYETAKRNNPDDPLNSRKANNTKMEKYGTFYPKRIYKLNQKILDELNINIKINEEIKFDSFPEVLFFITSKLKGKDIIRNKKGYEYKINNKIHHYYPDFIINNDIYEVKSNLGMDDNGNLTNIFTGEIENVEKCQCMKDNKVIVIKEKEIYNEINNYLDRSIVKQLRIKCKTW